MTRCAKPIDRHNCCCPLSSTILLLLFNVSIVSASFCGSEPNQRILEKVSRTHFSETRCRTTSPHSNNNTKGTKENKIDSTMLLRLFCFEFVFLFFFRFSSSIVDGIDWPKMNFHLLVRLVLFQLNQSSILFGEFITDGKYGVRMTGLAWFEF